MRFLLPLFAIACSPQPELVGHYDVDEVTSDTCEIAGHVERSYVQLYRDEEGGQSAEPEALQLLIGWVDEDLDCSLYGVDPVRFSCVLWDWEGEDGPVLGGTVYVDQGRMEISQQESSGCQFEVSLDWSRCDPGIYISGLGLPHRPC